MLIKKLQISNFRSLKDVTIPRLPRAVVFHGDNNSGKSNLILALNTIFARKVVTTEVLLPADAAKEARPPVRFSPFWNGAIADFSDNFYMGSTDSIEFHVRLEVPRKRFADLPEYDLMKGFEEEGHDFRVKLDGEIGRSRNDGMMTLRSCTVNDKVVFRRTGKNVQWFPSLASGQPTASRQRLAEGILNSFTDSVYIVPADRYLSSERPQNDIPSLDSRNFKNWLHGKSLSRNGFDIYESVRTRLNAPPFRYGELSFAREESVLDIMVDDGCGLRMPVASKGSGVQQILVLLGYILSSRASVIAIEEPELNLSFSSQDALVTVLTGLLNCDDSTVSQVLLASHSDHIGSRSELKQIHVENHDGRGTKVRKFISSDRSALFPRSKGRNRKFG